MKALKKEAPTSFSSMPSLHLLEPPLNFKKESMDNHKQEEEQDGDHEVNVIQPQSSSSSCSPCSSYQEHAIIKEKKTKVDDDDDDDEEEEEEESKEKCEDGYQTPTSPRSRIPVILRCPPAPKKPKWRRRHLLHPYRRKTTITSYFTLVLQPKVDPKKLGH
ncbi:Vacuolar protein sorting-associate protein Vta1/Callose synthase N-terminal protein [Dioscorea alata]|uniref:Vacuolar protein sorting-associate protein Vta1/Callose synthase N-terminal protein n=1 Tax=Dioscorea alata TaxID=55571 RepID=A0ACB7VU36_DIOAL|nr:Vacuolar protein sorting-associate protein Vta1/Callose synthase N-terminal protein [Dioscorea alata]